MPLLWFAVYRLQVPLLPVTFPQKPPETDMMWVMSRVVLTGLLPVLSFGTRALRSARSIAKLVDRLVPKLCVGISLGRFPNLGHLPMSRLKALGNLPPGALALPPPVANVASSLAKFTCERRTFTWFGQENCTGTN